MVRSLPTDRYASCPLCHAVVRIRFSSRRPRMNGTFAHHSPGFGTVVPTRPVQYCANGGQRAGSSE